VECSSTHDEDHFALAARGVEHSGIAYCHQRRRSLGEIIAGVTLLWQVCEPDEMRNRVEYSADGAAKSVRDQDRHGVARGLNTHGSQSCGVREFAPVLLRTLNE